MVDLAALDVEKQQVAGLQVFAIDFLAVAAGHGAGTAGQIDRRYIVERVFDQPAAIKAFTWAAAAPTIRSAQHVDRTAQHGAALLVGGDQRSGRYFAGSFAMNFTGGRT